MFGNRWRARAAVLSGALGACGALAEGPAVAHDPVALAEALGLAAQGVVLPPDVRWEETRGLVGDLLLGRRVLFLAGERAGAARDVWRARVRLAPDGRPLAVHDAHDLTGTPLGDDHSLVVHGQRAAFATWAFGREQSVTVLDLTGEPPLEVGGVGGRLLRAITNVQQTGSANGVGRLDVGFDQPARRVGLTLGAAELAIELQDDRGAVRAARLDLAKAEVTGTGAAGLHANLARPAPKRAVHWAVDTVRAVPWIGPAPIAWLEEKVFGVRDALRRATFAMRDGGDLRVDALAVEATAANAAEAQRLDGARAGHEGDGSAWPPPAIPSIWKTKEPGEGEWQPPRIPFLRRHALVGADAPSPFFRTFVRPDEQRPYAQVLFVAMDTRQLDLEMEAGSEDPKPLAGVNGPGHVPRDPATLKRVTAMFNGAFKTEHGHYGMMVKRRVLLPPQPDGATIVTLKDGRVALGSWPHKAPATATGGADLSGLAGIADEDIVSFRQNLDPLVELGKLNPSGRTQWGFTLPGTGVQTERSGVCVTGAGHLLYAWGDDVGATALAKAMRMAGCSYGMHLDMNPHHTGFVFAAIDEARARRYKTQLLSQDMELNPERFVEYSAKDFFYVLLRDPAPPPLAPGVAWSPSPGVQPSPAWMPGVFEARESGMELVAVEPGRAVFRVRAGTREPDAGAGVVPTTDLEGEDAARVLFAVGLGVATPQRMRGLAVDGKQILPAHGGTPEAPSGLLVARGGLLAIERGEELGSIGPHEDLVELPLLVDEGAVLAAANARGASLARGALGISKEGRVLVARGTFASHAPLAEALKRAGCLRVVGLDRGAHATPLFDRAGTSSSPRARYEQSTLYAVAATLRPRAFRFEARDTAALNGK